MDEQNLANLVLDRLKDKAKLSSPLKIRDYAISTVATTKEKELLEMIDEKSQEIAKSFANEINEMAQDKILFLMYFFTSDLFTIDYRTDILHLPQEF